MLKGKTCTPLNPNRAQRLRCHRLFDWLGWAELISTTSPFGYPTNRTEERVPQYSAEAAKTCRYDLSHTSVSVHESKALCRPKLCRPDVRIIAPSFAVVQASAAGTRPPWWRGS
jgi:hypothetical protein